MFAKELENLQQADKFDAETQKSFRDEFFKPEKTPTKEELLELFRFHLDEYDKHEKEVEKYPYEPLKHFFKVYINSFDGASDLRVKLMDCKSTDELRKVLDEYENA